MSRRKLIILLGLLIMIQVFSNESRLYAGDLIVNGKIYATSSEAGAYYATIRATNNSTPYAGYGIFSEATAEGGTGVYGYGRGTGVRGYGDVYGVIGNGAYGVMGGGTNYDFYAAGAGINYAPFTGAHEVRLADDVPANIKAGMLFSVTGEMQMRKDDQDKVSVSSTLPTVRLSNTANDKAVFGVYVMAAQLPEKHWHKKKVKDGERYAAVNAVGEGRMLVTNINGDIEPGDYVTTSPIPGYGQRQNDDLLHAYTAGKATEKVDWNNVTETIEFNGQKYKIYLIGVVYTSG